MTDWIFWAVGLALGISTLVSVFFALAESAMFSLGPWQLQKLPADDPARGPLVSKIFEHPRELLATVVLGNTVAHAVLVLLGVFLVYARYWELSQMILVVFILMLVVGEVLPKAFGVRYPEACALRLARWVWWVMILSRPFNRVIRRFNDLLLRWVTPSSVKPKHSMTEEEVEELFEAGFEEGMLKRSEMEYATEILNLDDRTAADAMIPRANMALIPDDLSIEQMIEAARRYKYRRLPIYDETPDTIVGVLNTRDFLLHPQDDLWNAVELPSFVPESMNLLKLLKSFQKQKRGMAIVVDEFGTTTGFITLEDILEEVVGEIRTEGEVTQFESEQLADGRWRVNGAMWIEDFVREYPKIGDVEEVDTLGGLLCHLLGYVPDEGESANYRGLQLRASRVDERRVLELTIKVLRGKR